MISVGKVGIAFLVVILSFFMVCHVASCIREDEPEYVVVTANTAEDARNHIKTKNPGQSITSVRSVGGNLWEVGLRR